MPLGDRLQRRAVEVLAGRRAELDRLEAFALGDEPLVMHIQGIPGIGKTHLLNALTASIRGKGVFVARIDARWCEPSPAALCRAICGEIGVSESEDPAVVASSLSDVTRKNGRSHFIDYNLWRVYSVPEVVLALPCNLLR